MKRNEMTWKMKWSEMKWNEMKWNEATWHETKWNEMKRKRNELENETKWNELNQNEMENETKQFPKPCAFFFVVFGIFYIPEGCPNVLHRPGVWQSLYSYVKNMDSKVPFRHLGGTVGGWGGDKPRSYQVGVCVLESRLLTWKIIPGCKWLGSPPFNKP